MFLHSPPQPAHTPYIPSYVSSYQNWTVRDLRQTWTVLSIIKHCTLSRIWSLYHEFILWTLCNECMKLRECQVRILVTVVMYVCFISIAWRFENEYWNGNLRVKFNTDTAPIVGNLSFVSMNLKVLKSVFHLTECAPTHGNIMHARGVQHVTRLKFAPKTFYIISYKTRLVGQQDRTTCPRQPLCTWLPSGVSELKFVLLQKKSILSSV
jgi:hypothetical protein